MEAIGAYEAKTHLARLLDEVANGKSVVITRHGMPIARLCPAHGSGPGADEVIAALRQARRGVTLNDVSIRALIDEGRR